MKVGFCLKDFSLSQLAYYAIKMGNDLIKQDVSVIGFYEDLKVQCARNDFPLMHSFETYGYGGILVATSLGTAATVLNSFSAQRRLFYVWDLEWLRLPYKQFGALHRIYSNDSLELIARSDEHAKAIRNCFNREAEVIENFNIAQFLTLLRR